MEQPKDYVKLKPNDTVMELTHREIIILRLSTLLSFVLGFLAGSLIF